MQMGLSAIVTQMQCMAVVKIIGLGFMVCSI